MQTHTSKNRLPWLQLWSSATYVLFELCMDSVKFLLEARGASILCGRYSWWRHQMETFSALLAIYAGNKPVPGDFPTQRPVTRSFDVFFNVRLNKRLSKQSWGWWFETLSPPLWRHCNVFCDNLQTHLGALLFCKALLIGILRYAQQKCFGGYKI